MKVGEYVRTDKGIAKYLGLGRDILKHETNKGTYEHYYNQHLFDNYIFDVGHDYGDTLIYDEFNNIDKLGKVKESIIDLIEVGDYVNGYLVKDIDYAFDDVIMNNKNARIVPYIDCNKDKYIDNIKSIVTKEQFESIGIRIGE